MTPEQYKTSRQILADLDAVGNTTKAITKGVAIGSAVIAAVSLFASFIAVIATGSEEAIDKLTITKFFEGAARLTVANPMVFVGLLIGGAVPFLFSQHDDPCRGTGGLSDRAGVPHAVQGQGDLGRDQEAGLRPGGRYLHRHRPEGTYRPRVAGYRRAAVCRFPAGTLCSRRLSGGHDRCRPAPGSLHGQRRRRLGQCQEDH